MHGNLNEKENDPGTFRSSSQRLMHARDVVVGRGLPSRQKKSNPKANKVILHADSQRKNVVRIYTFIHPFPNLTFIRPLNAILYISSYTRGKRL